MRDYRRSGICIRNIITNVTAEFPISRLEDIMNSNEVENIELARPVEPSLIIRR